MTKTFGLAALFSVTLALPALACPFGSMSAQVADTPIPQEEGVEVAQTPSPLLLPLVDNKVDSESED